MFIFRIFTKYGRHRAVQNSGKEKHFMNLQTKINTGKVGWENIGSEHFSSILSTVCNFDSRLFPGISTKNHSLELPFTGSANVVFNGSFFYYNQEKDSIVKLDLATRDKRCLQIPTGRQRQRVRHSKVLCVTFQLK